MFMLMLAAPVFADEYGDEKGDDIPEYNIHFQSFVDEKDADLHVYATPDGTSPWPIKDGYRLPEGYYILADAYNLSDTKTLYLLQLDGDGKVQETQAIEPKRSGLSKIVLKSDITYILRYADQNIITFTNKVNYGVDTTVYYLDQDGNSTDVKSGEPVPSGGVIVAKCYAHNGNYRMSAYVGNDLKALTEIQVGTQNGIIYPHNILRGLNEDITFILESSQGAFKPASTKISNVTAGHKKLTVKWSKPAENVTGYEVRYSKNKNFKSGVKKKRIKSADTTKCKLTGLKKGKKYYVQIHTYLTLDSNDTYYSKWSKTKSAKVK